MERLFFYDLEEIMICLAGTSIEHALTELPVVLSAGANLTFMLFLKSCLVHRVSHVSAWRTGSAAWPSMREWSGLVMATQALGGGSSKQFSACDPFVQMHGGSTVPMTTV